MKHILYVTTNTINGMIYIGIHSTENVDDGYLGSGDRLGRAIKKYGSENFFRETLEERDTREEVLQLEKERVTLEFTKHENTYNIAIGGLGGCGLVPVSDKTKKRMSESRTGEKNHFYGKRHSEETLKILKNRKFSKEHRTNISKARSTSKVALDSLAENRKIAHKTWKGSHHTEETKSTQRTASKNQWSDPEKAKEMKRKMSEGWAKRRLMKTNKLNVT